MPATPVIVSFIELASLRLARSYTSSKGARRSAEHYRARRERGRLRIYVGAHMQPETELVDPIVQAALRIPDAGTAPMWLTHVARMTTCVNVSNGCSRPK